MNPNNYATLEASRRLYGAGIVLDGTDMHWIKERDGSFSLILSDVHYDGSEEYPAPSMAEVWRELPDSHGSSTTLIVEKHYDIMIAGYFDWEEEDFTEAKFRNENPTDALIDLLIWLRGKKEAV